MTGQQEQEMQDAVDEVKEITGKVAKQGSVGVVFVEDKNRISPESDDDQKIKEVLKRYRVKKSTSWTESAKVASAKGLVLS